LSVICLSVAFRRALQALAQRRLTGSKELSRPLNGVARYEALAVSSSRGFAPVRGKKFAGRSVIRVGGVAQPVAEKVECKDGNNHVDNWKH